jgi:hypothetical protein
MTSVARGVQLPCLLVRVDLGIWYRVVRDFMAKVREDWSSKSGSRIYARRDVRPRLEIGELPSGTFNLIGMLLSSHGKETGFSSC